MLPSFSIDLPDGWSDQTAYQFAGPDDRGTSHLLTLIVDRNPVTDDLETYADDRIRQQQDSAPDMELVGRRERTLESGVTACEVSFRWMPNDDQVIFRRFVYLLVDEVAYTFACDFSKRSRKTVGPQMDRIIESFTPHHE